MGRSRRRSASSSSSSSSGSDSDSSGDDRRKTSTKEEKGPQDKGQDAEKEKEGKDTPTTESSSTDPKAAEAKAGSDNEDGAGSKKDAPSKDSDREDRRGGRDRGREDRRDDRRGRDRDDRDTDRRGRREEKELVERNPRAEAIARGKKKTEKVADFTMKTGGAYIPPARLRAMQQEITDKSSEAYQRMAWDALKKSINGLVNKVNVSNIQDIVLELFAENLVRGRGLLCRSLMKAQMASQTYTKVYAGLVAIINTKFPQNGELLLKRLVIQFRRSYRRSDKAACLGLCKFIAQLANQEVAPEILILEILTLLLEKPTDDSVEVAIAFLKEAGQHLQEISPAAVNNIFEDLRSILHESSLTDKRIQYMIEVMMAIRKDGFKDYPKLVEDLDLVEEEDQITHELFLEEVKDEERLLDVFKFDPEYEKNEEMYKELREEILGEGGDSDDEDDSDDDSDADDESDDPSDEPQQAVNQQGEMVIVDMTDTQLKIFRRTVYLAIMSSASYEECAHKLLKMTLQPGMEKELASMIVECCCQERSYLKFYGLLAARFCSLQRNYQDAFCQELEEQYTTVHRLETNKLRQCAKLFAHLFYTDSVPWNVFEIVRLNENDTTSSSRIFIKELMLEISEFMGVELMVKRFTDPYMSMSFAQMFPKDSPKNTRFAINFFTSIGLGGLTDDLREHLQNAPKMIMAQQREGLESDSESGSDSDSSSGSDSDSSSSGSSSGSDSSSGSSSSGSSSSGSSSDSGDDSKASPPRSRKVKEAPKKVAEPRKDTGNPNLDMTGDEVFAARMRLSRGGGGSAPAPDAKRRKTDGDEGDRRGRGRDDGAGRNGDRKSDRDGSNDRGGGRGRRDEDSGRGGRRRSRSRSRSRSRDRGDRGGRRDDRRR